MSAMTAFLKKVHIKGRILQFRERRLFMRKKNVQPKIINPETEIKEKYDCVPMAATVFLILILTTFVSGEGISLFVNFGMPVLGICGVAALIDIITGH